MKLLKNEVNKSHIKPPGEVQYYIETFRDYFPGIVLKIIILSELSLIYYNGL